MQLLVVNDISNSVFGLAKAYVYGFCKSWKQKFIMSFIIITERNEYTMDYNQMPIGLGLAFMENRLSSDGFYNMTDDEKKEYIERNRSNLSDSDIDKLTSSIGEDEDDGSNFDDMASIFRGPGIG